MSEYKFTVNLNGSILEYIPPRNLRTVLVAQREIPHGFSEIPIDFNLAGIRLKGLDFDIPDDGMLYGYIHQKDELLAKLGLDTAPKSVDLFVNDGDIFLMFTTEDEKDALILKVEPNELVTLLNGCRRVPQQRKL